MTDRMLRSQGLLFALPQFALGAITAPVFYVLPAFYAQYTSASLAALGSVLIVTRIFDAVTDPLIGYFGDRTRTRWGARKPWIFSGSLLIAWSIWCLFTPDPASGVNYFLLWSLVFYTGWTMFELPYGAWLTEVTRNYNDRARISGFMGLAAQLGGFAFFAVFASGLFPSRSVSPELLAIMGLISAIALPACTSLAMAYVPAGVPVATRKPAFRDLFEGLTHNKPLRLLLLSQLFGGLGGGIYLTTQLLLLTSYFGQGDKFAILFMVYQGVHFLAMPVWLRIIYRIGKHRAWGLSWTMSAMMLPLTMLVPPGPDALKYLLVLAALRSFLAGADIIAPKALMADAIDYGILRTRANPAGSYFALHSLAVKICAAFSSGIALYLLALVGFDAKIDAVNSPEAIRGLLIVSLVLPTIFNVAAALCIWKFPLDRRRAGIIRRCIEARAARAAAASVQSAQPMKV
jgi:GPH family glycoside/pentoside/hexuronide:cation symporter